MTLMATQNHIRASAPACRVCGAPLVCRSTEKQHKFRERQTCGGACGHAWRTQRSGEATRRYPDIPDSATKACAHCGGLFAPTRYPGGKRETVANWVERRFCSRRCGVVHANRERHHVTPSGPMPLPKNAFVDDPAATIADVGSMRLSHCGTYVPSESSSAWAVMS